jgi:glutathione synthase/RimK-type ligase-like ATP-grasp enzyme
MEVFQDKPKVLFTAAIADDGLAEVLQLDTKGIMFNPSGCSNVFNYINSNSFEKRLTIFDHKQSYTFDPAKLKNVDLIFNQISSPETHKISLLKMDKLLKKVNILCINNPQNILQTERDNIYRLLKGIDNLTVPKTIKINPSSPGEVYDHIRESDFQFPVIFRKAGLHGGKNTTLLYGYNEYEKFYPFAIDGSDYYLIQYVDYKQDGVYKKFRLVVVDGEVFIRHIIYSDHWMIHSSSREYMEKNSSYQEKEKDILETFDSYIKPEIQPVIQTIHEILGLDYFGIDCYIDSNMHILIFEVNANMNIMVNNQQNKYSIWDKKISAIVNALTQTIIKKINTR